MNLINLNKLKEFCGKYNKLYIWGAGNFGLKTVEYLHNQNIIVENIIDNNEKKVGEIFQGVEVINFEKLLPLNNETSCIVICSSYFDEIQEQLKSSGISNYAILDNLLYFMNFEKFYVENETRFNKMFKNLDKESIKVFRDILSFRRNGDYNLITQSVYPQYFHPKVSPATGEIIIDGGAFQGDTVEQFKEALNMECSIHSFEPTFQNFIELDKIVKNRKYRNVFVNEMGLGEKSEQLKISYNEIYPAGSKITEDGEEIIQITSIDDYVNKNNIGKIDLIKLDVEGFELATLKGAVTTIETNRPKLQVCLYHSNEDLIDIYEYLVEQFNHLNYKFYIGHHSDVFWETVLYAICEK